MSIAMKVREGLANLWRQQIQIREILDGEVPPSPDLKAVEKAV